MTPVAERSVANVIVVAVFPESVTFVLSGKETLFRWVEVELAFPTRSVATIVTVLSHPARSNMVFDQVPDQRVAAKPLTITLATHPVSMIAPVRVGKPLTIALSAWEVIVMTGGIVSVAQVSV